MNLEINFADNMYIRKKDIMEGSVTLKIKGKYVKKAPSLTIPL